MSQMFNEQAKVIPFTELLLLDEKETDKFETMEIGKKVILSGKTKGRGFAGTVKRWGFRAGPNTHGQLYPRRGGSIGTQGQDRVIPGKKMPGRMGGNISTFVTRFEGFDKDRKVIKVRGGVPGSRNSEVEVYI